MEADINSTVVHERQKLYWVYVFNEENSSQSLHNWPFYHKINDFEICWILSISKAVSNNTSKVVNWRIVNGYSNSFNLNNRRLKYDSMNLMDLFSKSRMTTERYSKNELNNLNYIDKIKIIMMILKWYTPSDHTCTCLYIEYSNSSRDCTNNTSNRKILTHYKIHQIQLIFAILLQTNRLWDQ